MNVIFLDIDGVLTTARTSIAYNEARIRTLDPVSVRMIASICKQSNMKICIISDWKIDYPLRADFIMNFSYFGGGPLVPHILKNENWRTPILGPCSNKSVEITDWLSRHQYVRTKVVIVSNIVMGFEDCQVVTLPYDGYGFQNYLDTIKIIEEKALQYGQSIVD